MRRLAGEATAHEIGADRNQANGRDDARPPDLKPGTTFRGRSRRRISGAGSGAGGSRTPGECTVRRPGVFLRPASPRRIRRLDQVAGSAENVPTRRQRQTAVRTRCWSFGGFVSGLRVLVMPQATRRIPDARILRISATTPAVGGVREKRAPGNIRDSLGRSRRVSAVPDPAYKDAGNTHERSMTRGALSCDRHEGRGRLTADAVADAHRKDEGYRTSTGSSTPLLVQ